MFRHKCKISFQFISLHYSMNPCELLQRDLSYEKHLGSNSNWDDPAKIKKMTTSAEVISNSNYDIIIIIIIII